MIDVNRRVLPGFGLSLGYALLYMSLLVLHPAHRLLPQGLVAGPRTSSSPRCGRRARAPPTG